MTDSPIAPVTTLSALIIVCALGLFSVPPAVAQTATNLNCNKCVGAGDIAKQAVTTSRLKKNAVTGSRIKNGSVGFKDLSPAVRKIIGDLQAQAAASVPVGTVVAFAGPASQVPDGWLLCDGSEVDETTFAALFAVIGDSHGGGDGVSTFHLPDYRGSFLRGVDHDMGGPARDPDRDARMSPQIGALGGAGNFGNSVGSVQEFSTALPNMPWTTDDPGNHNHNNGAFDRLLRVTGTLTAPGADDTALEPDLINSAPISPAGAHTHSIGGGDSETRPLNAYVNFIIKH